MTGDHPNALPEGYALHWYRIEKVLGQGGFGITYLARDTNLEKQVAIKEYLPVEFAARGDGHTVQPRSGAHGKKYAWGLDRFIKEARMLGGFDHPNIVHVHSVFEYNATAYMVMRFERGRNLHDVIGGNETLAESKLRAILLPILDGLEVVHAAGIVHRDIKPDNVYLRDDGTPVLLDFGSARVSPGDSRTLTILVAPGYAPFEQYYSGGSQQGPWSDIYSLGATLYHAVAGFPPVDAIARSKGILGSTRDVLIPATQVGEGRYSVPFLTAIDHALRFNERDRPQSVAEWRGEILGEGGGPPPAASPGPAARLADNPAPATAAATSPAGASDPAPGGAGRTRQVVGIAVVLILVTLAAWPWLVPEWPAGRPDPGAAVAAAERERASAEDAARRAAARAAALEAEVARLGEAVTRLESERDAARAARLEADRSAQAGRERLAALDAQVAGLRERLAAAESAAGAAASAGHEALDLARRERAAADAAREAAAADAEESARRLAEAESMRGRLEAERERLARLEDALGKRGRALDAESRRLRAESDRIARLARLAGSPPAAATPALSTPAPLAESSPPASPPATGDLAAGLAAYEAGDFATALARLRPLAERGDAAARHRVGLMHALGQGTPVDEAEAARWQRLAAEQGHAPAQNSLAVMHATGRGVERDDAAAAAWYEKAAKQGHAEAQANLARLFEIGRGVPRDEFQAYGWYHLAAAAGNEAARAKRERLAGRLQPLEREHAEKLFATFAGKSP